MVIMYYLSSLSLVMRDHLSTWVISGGEKQNEI